MSHNLILRILFQASYPENTPLGKAVKMLKTNIRLVKEDDFA